MRSHLSPEARKHVVLVTPDLFGGGGGIARISRATALACSLAVRSFGARLTALSLNDTGLARDVRYLPEDCGYRGFQGSRFRLASEVVRLSWSRSHALTIFCHVNLSVLGLLSPAWTQYVVIGHGIEVWTPLPRLRRTALRRAAEVWPVSRYTGELIEAVHAVPANRIRVIQNCLDPEWEVAKSGAPAEARDSDYGLAVSRMGLGDAYKGIDTVIRAFSRVWPTRPTSRLHIVGDGADRGRLEALAKELGAGDRIRFLGGVDDRELRTQYRDCRFFVLPSRKEGFGLVYLEAMAAGKPVLAARSTAVPEIVRDRECGELVAYGDDRALAESMGHLFDDPELARSYGQRGLEIATTEFAFDTYRTKVESALRGLVRA
jgi:phosphatidyl-myo-inositol dimannoside synthase